MPPKLQKKAVPSSRYVILRMFYAQMVVFMRPKEFWEAYSNRTARPSVPLRVRCKSPVFSKVGIPNLVCGCIRPSVPLHVRSKFGVWMHFGIAECHVPFSGHCDLDLDL